MAISESQLNPEKYFGNCEKYFGNHENCHVQALTSCQRFSTLLPFTYSKLVEEREERGSKYKEHYSAINVEAKLGTMIPSDITVEN